MNILVVDDHDEFREEVIGILARNGHAATGAARAADAVALAETGEFDSILIDFSMPEHSGLWFLEHVRLPAHTRVFLATAHVSEQLVHRVRQAGAAGCLIKPFTESQLLSRLAAGAANLGGTAPP